jgi:hypothetical protein
MLLPVQSSLNSIAFSSNGSLYLVQDGSHEISIYNATTVNVRPHVHHPWSGHVHHLECV